MNTNELLLTIIGRLDKIDGRLDGIENRLTKLESRVTKIELMLENTNKIVMDTLNTTYHNNQNFSRLKENWHRASKAIIQNPLVAP